MKLSELRLFNTELFFILLVLRLCHVIDWSWWWIFAPFWVPLSLAVAALPFVWLAALWEKRTSKT